MKAHIKSGIYKHYQGGFYKVLGIARHNETDEEFVVYREISRGLETGEGPMLLCERAQFLEDLNYRGKEVSRFTYVSAH